MRYSILFLCSVLALQAEDLGTVNIENTSAVETSYLLSEEEVLDRGDVTIQESLKKDVSFNVISGDKGGESISFRGLNFKNTDYIENDIPLYRSVNGIVDTAFMMGKSSIEFNNGSGSGALGVSAAGGELQLNLKRPTKEIESQLDTTINSNDQYYHTYVGSALGDFSVQADASYYYQKSFTLSNDFTQTDIQEKRERVNSDKLQKALYIKSDYDFNEAFHIAAKLSLSQSEYGMPVNIYTPTPSVVFDAFSRVDRQDLSSLYLYGDYENDAFEVKVRAYADSYGDDYVIYDNLEYSSSWPIVHYDDQRQGGLIKSIFTTAQTRNSAVLQIEDNVHVRSGGGLDRANFSALTARGSLMNLWSIDENFELETALSYAYMNLKSKGDDKTALDALVKMSYEDELNSAYASVAKKSRLPTILESFALFPSPIRTENPSLKSEQSLQYTLSLSREVAQESSISLDLYYYDIKDLIVIDSKKAYVNRESAQHYGLELRAVSEYFKDNKIDLSYAYAHAQDSTGDRLELIPKHKLKLEEHYQISKRFKANAIYQFIGTRYSYNNAQYNNDQYVLNEYHLLDAQMMFELDKKTQFRLGIKNILDQNYEWRYGYPTPGRNYYISAMWKI